MRYSIFAALAFLGLLFTACGQQPTTRSIQAQKAAEAANSLTFTDNTEIDNIKRRLTLTSKPGIIGYALLLNEAGQPIYYTTVKGKITSGGKRLTNPQVWYRNDGYGPGPSDEGTYGNSGEYIYFWDANDQYFQWNGKYLYSNNPFRLRIDPLVINVGKESK